MPREKTIALLLTSPSVSDMQYGRTLSGANGRLLQGFYTFTGIDPEEVEIITLFDIPTNKWKLSPAIRLRSEATFIGRIARSTARVLVPLDDLTLSIATKKTSLNDQRGSILTSIIHGKTRKTIPTYHPAEVFKQHSPKHHTTTLDWQRIAKERYSYEVTRLERHFNIPRNRDEVLRMASTILDSDNPIGMDIESNMHTHAITCVGFATSASDGFTFSFRACDFSDGAIGRDASVLAVRQILASPLKMWTQNGNFDCTYLKTKGFVVNGWEADSLYLHHMLEVELPRSLDYLTSLYTDQPFYKDMVEHAIAAKQMNWLQMARYNCLDCMVTLEIVEKLRQRAVDMDKWDWYLEKYTETYEPLMEAQLVGIRMDLEKRKEVAIGLEQELLEVEAELQAFVPADFITSKDAKTLKSMKAKLQDMETSGKQFKKDGTVATRYLNWKEKLAAFTPSVSFTSPPQMQDLLYRGLKIPKRRKHGKTTTDNEALTKILRSKTPSEQAKRFCTKLLEHRGLAKLITTYVYCPIDKDGRIRCEYKIAGTKSGRLSSATSPFGTGCNLQNIPARKGRGGLIRSLFLPDIGDIFVGADYGQAEARVVGYLSGEQSWIDQFEQGNDLFNFIASRIFNCQPDEVTKEQRNTTKTIVHASDYGMQVEHFAFTANLEMVKAKVIWKTYHESIPRIIAWRQRVQEEAEASGILTTPMGRFRILRGQLARKIHNSDGSFSTQWDNNYLRDIWSYLPQSTVGDLLNLALRKTWKAVLATPDWTIHRPRFALQIHDEQIWSVHPADEEKFKTLMTDEMRIPLTINGRTFTIPTSTASGKTWAECK